MVKKSKRHAVYYFGLTCGVVFLYDNSCFIGELWDALNHKYTYGTIMMQAHIGVLAQQARQAQLLSTAPYLPRAFSTMTLQDPTWNMDTGASSHLNSHTSNLNTIYNKCLYPSVCVGDGKTIPVTNTGQSILPTLNRPLYLHNVLITPNIIKNLISVRQFTRDNNCTVEFDAFGFSVKDFLTRHILLRCDSSGDLYPVTQPSPSCFTFG